MPPNPRPTIRLIAQRTGFSKATVANALNGTPTVAEGTAALVLKVAAEVGYRRNSMVGALMSAVRRSGEGSLQGVLAVVEIGEPDRPGHGVFHDALLEGCRECASELGFSLDFFRLDPGEMSPERLSGIMKARGIRGVVLLPSWKLPDFNRFDWSWLTGVYADYLSEEPSLNSVCCDHYRTVLEALEKLYALGYRRPGMIFEEGREERIHMRMSAALRTFQATHQDIEQIGPKFVTRFTKELVLDWVEEVKPDVVLAHQGNEVMDWIQETSYEIPSEIGFFCLNLTKTTKETAGLDLRPTEIGRCAIEQLVAQVQRQAWGRARTPTTTSVVGKFVHGPTLIGNVGSSGKACHPKE